MVPQRGSQALDRKGDEITGDEDDQVRHADFDRDGVAGKAFAEDRQRLARQGEGREAQSHFLSRDVSGDRRPAGLEDRRLSRDQPPRDGVARRASRAVGAEGGEAAVRVEVVEMNPPLSTSGEEERAVGSHGEAAPAEQRDSPAVFLREDAPVRLEEEEVVSAAGHLHETRGKRHRRTSQSSASCRAVSYQLSDREADPSLRSAMSG